MIVIVLVGRVSKVFDTLRRVSFFGSRHPSQQTRPALLADGPSPPFPLTTGNGVGVHYLNLVILCVTIHHRATEKLEKVPCDSCLPLSCCYVTE